MVGSKREEYMMSDIDLSPDPGSYVLALILSAREKIEVGAMGSREFQRGLYLYAGSAFGPGGVRARVGRHLRHQKQHHWHIDFLQPQIRTKEVWILPSSREVEHQAAHRLQEHPLTTIPVAGFGASDCSCAAHLFYSRKPDSRTALFQDLDRDWDISWLRFHL